MDRHTVDIKNLKHITYKKLQSRIQVKDVIKEVLDKKVN